jgi:glycosyltransferase involved in cell wall biosynthesis
MGQHDDPHAVHATGATAPAVSVVIPTRSRPSLLSRAIGTALAQTVDDLEVVVVVDGPDEATRSLVSRHGDERVRLVAHEENRGPSAARNSGIAAARGTFVAFLDDDDLWHPTKLARQLPLLQSGADVVHSLVAVGDADGKVYERPSERGYRIFRTVAAAGYPYSWLLRRSCYQINAVVVRKSCIDAVGGFDEALAATEDLDFVHRLRRQYELVLVDEPLATYCFHGTGTSARRLAEGWWRLTEKELAYVRTAGLPDARAAEAFLLMRRAQSAYILGRYPSALQPAVAAMALDRRIVSPRQVATYAAAAVLPRAFVDRLRDREQTGPPREPDPWIDLG